MSFNLSDKAKKYFKNIDKNSKSGKFKIQFDFYYLCLIVGLLNEKLSEEASGEEIIKTFPGFYHNIKEQIISILITTEIRRRDIDFSNREQIKKIILEIVDPDSPSKLSGAGIKLINKYTQSGFEILNQKMPNIKNLDDFLIRYCEELLFL